MWTGGCHFNRLLFTTLVLGWAGQTVHAQTGYDIVDLGSLNGGYSAAYGINNLGQVCGASSQILQDGSIGYRPVIFSGGQVQDLGRFGTAYVMPQPGIVRANSINDRGEVVGTTDIDNYAGGQFLYSNGVLQQLPYSTQNAIANNGDRAGGPDANNHAYLYNKGIYTDMGTLGGIGSEAFALNNVGQVVGQAEVSHVISVPFTAFLYQNGKMQDIGKDTGLYNSTGYGINDSGGVVGAGQVVSGDYSTYRAFIWQKGQSQTLGTLGGASSDALAVNKYGVVVGYSNLSNRLTDPFVYQNGQMSDLFAGTGWISGQATAINDSGQIVGYGFHNGVNRAFLATPKAAPAPSSLLVCGLGCLPCVCGAGSGRWSTNSKPTARPCSHKPSTSIPAFSVRKKAETFAFTCSLLL